MTPPLSKEGTGKRRGAYGRLPTRGLGPARQLRVAPTEFRGQRVQVDIDAHFVTGGAEITIEIGGAVVYDHDFIAHMLPYEARMAIGAGTRGDATTTFDVAELFFCGHKARLHAGHPHTWR